MTPKEDDEERRKRGNMYGGELEKEDSEKKDLSARGILGLDRLNVPPIFPFYFAAALY
jgi:hypothetical protein